MAVPSGRLRSLAIAATGIAERAGALVEESRSVALHVRRKPDGTPVTEADERAEALIAAALAALTPGTAVIGEEAVAREGHDVPASGAFWLVDPIDGTRAFAAGSAEYTVNIALVEARRPVLGVIAAPALGRVWRASGPDTAEARRDGGAWTAIATRQAPADGAVAVSSKTFGDRARLGALLRGTPVREYRHIDSSLKLCLVAEGAADVYPRYGPSSEWDTAAGQAVVTAAGGSVRTADGEPLRYGKPGWANPDFVARG